MFNPLTYDLRSRILGRKRCNYLSNIPQIFITLGGRRREYLYLARSSYYGLCP